MRTFNLGAYGSISTDIEVNGVRYNIDARVEHDEAGARVILNVGVWSSPTCVLYPRGFVWMTQCECAKPNRITKQFKSKLMAKLDWDAIIASVTKHLEVRPYDILHSG